MSQKALELIVARNGFYEKNYRQILILNVFLFCITITLVLFIFYQSKIQDLPQYFPTTPDGRLIISPPLNINHLLLDKQKIDPITNKIVGMPLALTYDELKSLGQQALVIHWVKLAINSIFNYDYVHYREAIQSSRQFFTAQGFARFMQALLDSKNLASVKDRKSIVYPKINGEIKIMAEGEIEGHHAWRIEVPLKIIYENVISEPIEQVVKANILVVRISTLESPFYGLAISQINLIQQF